MMKLAPVASMALIVLLLSVRTVRACSCAPPPPIDEAFAAADAVFLGEVIAQEAEDPYSDGMRAINFRVIQSWRGVAGTEVGVLTPASCASCGIDSEVGDRFVLYARVNPFEDNRLTISLCSRTGLLDGALDDVAELERLGIEPLELDEGPDAMYPPANIHLALCGAGLVFSMACNLIGFVLLRFRSTRAVMIGCRRRQARI